MEVCQSQISLLCIWGKYRSGSRTSLTVLLYQVRERLKPLFTHSPNPWLALPALVFSGPVLLLPRCDRNGRSGVAFRSTRPHREAAPPSRPRYNWYCGTRRRSAGCSRGVGALVSGGIWSQLLAVPPAPPGKEVPSRDPGPICGQVGIQGTSGLITTTLKHRTT